MTVANEQKYNPAIHHRQSLRLNGHDYAGGGLYFVTICAHRAAGNVFAAESVKKMVGHIWKKVTNPDWQNAPVGAGLVPAAFVPDAACVPNAFSATHQGGRHKASPYVVMPDHFHGIVRINGQGKGLGAIIGAFKSLVVHEYIAGVKAGIFARFNGKIWHRNYYEMIVRTPEAESKITEYIRMNPWKNIIHLGNGMRGIGNPNLMNAEKIGMLCSRNCPSEVLKAAEKRALAARENHCLMSGFHSPPEKEILAALLRRDNTHVGPKLICCPAWGIDKMKIPADWIPALEANRMLILEMRNEDANLAAARERNIFVIQSADKLWTPHISQHGMLESLIQETNTKQKIITSGR